MKKIILMLLVAMVPFLTMAQKRSKKAKKVKTEKMVELNSSFVFMVITGYETTFKEEVRNGVSKTIPTRSRSVEKDMMKSNSKFEFNFDFGRVKFDEISKLSENASNYRTLATALNAAAYEGWDFLSSNVILSGKDKIHYLYMRKKR